MDLEVLLLYVPVCCLVCSVAYCQWDGTSTLACRLLSGLCLLTGFQLTRACQSPANGPKYNLSGPPLIRQPNLKACTRFWSQMQPLRARNRLGDLEVELRAAPVPPLGIVPAPAKQNSS